MNFPGISKTSPTPQASWDSLPVEIRFEIYRRTWEPRVVTLDCDDTEAIRVSGKTADGDNLYSSYLRVYSPPPITLHLNTEAREETLRYYRPFFQSDAGSVAYINPGIDLLQVKYFPYFAGGDVDAERILNAVSVARHIHAAARIDMRFKLIAALDCDPGRFTNVFTVDDRLIIENLAQKKRAYVWTRMCRTPGCTTPNSRPDKPVWRYHHLKHVNLWNSEQLFPFRNCEDVAGGMQPCDVKDQARQAIGKPLCRDPLCRLHDKVARRQPSGS